LSQKLSKYDWFKELDRNAKQDRRIDERNLFEENITQADHYGYWVDEAKQARKDFQVQKKATSRVEYKIQLKYLTGKATIEDKDGKVMKLTAAGVTAAVNSHPDVIAAQDTLVELEAKYEYLQGVVDSMVQRRSAIKYAVDMSGRDSSHRALTNGVSSEDRSSEQAKTSYRKNLKRKGQED